MSDEVWTSERSIKIWNDKTGYNIYVGPDSDGLDLVEITTKDASGRVEATAIIDRTAALAIADAIIELYRV